MNNAQLRPFNMDHPWLHDLIKSQQAAHRLVVYRGLLKDKVITSFLDLLQTLTLYPSTVIDTLNAYHEFVYSLINHPTPGNWPNAWQRYLVNAVLADENAFSRQAEYMPLYEISPSLCEAVRHDLICLQQVFLTPADSIRRAAIERIGEDLMVESGLSLFTWEEMMFSEQESPDKSLVLLGSTNWGEDIDKVAAYCHANSTGHFQHYRAFRWEKLGGDGCLTGISRPDVVSPQDLIGLEQQQAELDINTQYFLSGLPANHVLLYGPRGTGKTSMVKSLLNRYCDQGLRIIELPKQYLNDLPVILNRVSNRAFHFIIFVDDLSFEDYEVDYKVLKTVLEGGMERLPGNALIYATSNRRHIVKELFSDREFNEIHGDDTVQEKLSIADRFGITITFPYPSQPSYLAIVRGLACRHHLDLSDEELVKQALQWEKSHSGPSGRTASQFVDHLVAESGFKRRMK
ncbi:MAG: ATP-binding protein [Syntrophomonadales bacterium]|jgi:predicted AAA+ superfamily ATPase